jgi:hypothetical protein
MGCQLKANCIFSDRGDSVTLDSEEFQRRGRNSELVTSKNGLD